MIVTTLEELRGRRYVGAVELADQAARLIGDYVPRQERASVTEVPDERMIRYYLSEGLLAPPEGRQGSAAIYGYLHLLQLLVIKRLQAEHLPIKKIREVVEGAPVEALEGLLGPSRPATDGSRCDSTAAEYLQSVLATTRDRERWNSPPGSRPMAAPLSGGQHTASWARIEVEPGLELNVREGYVFPDDPKERQRLLRWITGALEALANTTRKWR